FNPINLFCIFYITIPLTSIYYIFTDFNNSIFIDKYLLKGDYVSLFNLATFYYLLGLVCLIAGYRMFKNSIIGSMKFHSGNNSEMSDILIRCTAYILSLIGLFNFLFNVVRFSGGNILNYLSNVALRHHEFSEVGGTTAGYHFLYIGAYLILYLHIKNKSSFFELLIIVIISTIVKASVGRIYGTVVHLMSFIAMFYFSQIGKAPVLSIYNRKFIIGALFLVLMGGVFYFYRVYSARSIGTDIVFEDLISEFSGALGMFVFDKGNTPTVALFMKIIDSWSHDYGYLYGKSLFSGILPLELINNHGYNTSIITQELWYSHLPSGALPTTAVGELYMNFGPIGVPIFMFFFGVVLKLFFIYAI